MGVISARINAVSPRITAAIRIGTTVRITTTIWLTGAYIDTANTGVITSIGSITTRVASGAKRTIACCCPIRNKIRRRITIINPIATNRTTVNAGAKGTISHRPVNAIGPKRSLAIITSRLWTISIGRTEWSRSLCQSLPSKTQNTNTEHSQQKQTHNEIFCGVGSSLNLNGRTHKI